MRETGCQSWKPAALHGCAIALLLAAGAVSAQGLPATVAPHARPSPATLLSGETSVDARRLAAWITANGDNNGLPFLIVDKTGAQVIAMDPQGRAVSAAPALLGLARGDDSPLGIGDRKLAAITPQERITPAGRFAAVLGENLGGKTVLWVDYDAAISLHAVITTNPSEHRLQRLATPSTSDNRISYGCINVPADFFNTVVGPLLKAAGGIVYILPETRSIASVFFKHPVGAASRTQTPEAVPPPATE